MVSIIGARLGSTKACPPNFSTIPDGYLTTGAWPFRSPSQLAKQSAAPVAAQSMRDDRHIEKLLNFTRS